MPLKTTDRVVSLHRDGARHGRGATLNLEGRYEAWRREGEDDGWYLETEEAGDATRPQTVVTEETAKSIISRNASPDIPFSLSVNPYRGCEHGCVYCFARPSHAYLGLSPGLDFETRIFAKTNAAALLREELSRPGYRCEPISLGINTDAYQPAEKRYRITRALLEVMTEARQPVALITKSALIERDLDLLVPLARQNLVHVAISLTTLQHDLSRYLEPRTVAPTRRLQTIETLAKAGVPVTAMVAPVIPVLTDHELETVLKAAAEAGATRAGYVLLRLPWELKPLFRDWLHRRFPLKADHVMSRLVEMRSGRENDPRFGSRMTGEGLFAAVLKQRFANACRRLGLNRPGPEGRAGSSRLDITRFRPPSRAGQGELF